MKQKNRKSDNISPKKSLLGDSLRERISIVSKEEIDIGDIWAEQKRIYAEDKRLAEEYKQAKIKAKELKSKLQNSHREEDLYILKNRVKTLTKNIKKSDFLTKIVTILKNLLVLILRAPLILLEFFKKLSFMQQIATGFVAFFIVILGLISLLPNNSTQTDILGDSVESSSNSALPDDNRINGKPDFKLVFPTNSADLQSVTRKAPDGSVIYSFADQLDGARIEVTEQQLPDAFKKDLNKELAELAKVSYLADIIQIDETLVYHGYSETKEVQSLIFVKDELLIFIRSDQKLSDDIWVGYISNLK
jgi:hypothetical protein